MDLVLIRHPRVAVAEGVCYGASDVALRDDPAHSAAQIAARLAALGAPAPVMLVTSPLRRCATVATALAAASGSTVAATHGALAEMDFGAWESQRWDAIDRAQLDVWAADFDHARPHGGESVAQFAGRVRQWFDETVESADASHDGGCASGPVHVVTHAGVIRTLASLTLGVPLEQCLRWSLNLPAIVWFERRTLRAGQSGAWSLKCWNA